MGSINRRSKNRVINWEHIVKNKEGIKISEKAKCRIFGVRKYAVKKCRTPPPKSFENGAVKIRAQLVSKLLY